MLVHIVDGSSPDPVGDFNAIQTELELFAEDLASKPQASKLRLQACMRRLHELAISSVHGSKHCQCSCHDSNVQGWIHRQKSMLYVPNSLSIRPDFIHFYVCNIAAACI